MMAALVKVNPPKLLLYRSQNQYILPETIFYEKGAPLDELFQISIKMQPFCLESHVLVSSEFHQVHNTTC